MGQQLDRRLVSSQAHARLCLQCALFLASMGMWINENTIESSDEGKIGAALGFHKLEGTYLEPKTSSPALTCGCFQFAAPPLLLSPLMQCYICFLSFLSLFVFLCDHSCLERNCFIHGYRLCLCTVGNYSSIMDCLTPEAFGHLSNHLEANVGYRDIPVCTGKPDNTHKCQNCRVSSINYGYYDKLCSF